MQTFYEDGNQSVTDCSGSATTAKQFLSNWTPFGDSALARRSADPVRGPRNCRTASFRRAPPEAVRTSTRRGLSYMPGIPFEFEDGPLSADPLLLGLF